MATLAEKREERTILYAAYIAALKTKSYSRNSAGGSSLSVQHQDVKILKEQLDILDAEIEQLSGTVSRTVYIRPQDA